MAALMVKLIVTVPDLARVVIGRSFSVYRGVHKRVTPRPVHLPRVLTSSGDMGIDRRSGILNGATPIGNKHGCVERINGQWYVFYHRHTDGRDMSRRAAAEPIEMRADGSTRRTAVRESIGSHNGHPAHLRATTRPRPR